MNGQGLVHICRRQGKLLLTSPHPQLTQNIFEEQPLMVSSTCGLTPWQERRKYLGRRRAICISVPKSGRTTEQQPADNITDILQLLVLPYRHRVLARVPPLIFPLHRCTCKSDLGDSKLHAPRSTMAEKSTDLQLASQPEPSIDEQEAGDVFQPTAVPWGHGSAPSVPSIDTDPDRVGRPAPSPRTSS